MRIFCLVIFLVGTGCQLKKDSLSQTLSGVTADNGGDIVVCTRDPELQSQGGAYFEGAYSLDYILTFDPNPGVGDEIVTQDQWLLEDHTNRIGELLDEKFPNMAASFREYMIQLRSSDPAGRRVWQRSSIGLVDFHDEQFIQTLPDNCYVTRDGERKLNIHQVVLRRRLLPSPDKVFYVYDHANFEDLAQSRPLQLSFLVVHEWLWDYTDSPWANRTFNRLLHSRHFDDMSGDELQRMLSDFGVVLSENGNLVAAAEQDGVLETAFRGNRFCNWDFKTVKEFQPQTNTFVLQPGESKDLNMVLLSNDDVLGNLVCGFSLMIPFRGQNAPTLKVNLQRGALLTEFEIGLNSGDPGYDLRLAMCRDRLCLRRAGDDQLQRLLPRGVPAGEWVLKLENTSNEPVTVRRPYMTFVRMDGQ